MSARIECPPEHKHGATRTCYVRHTCRCTACIDRNRQYEAQRKAEVAAARKAAAYTRPVIDASRTLVEISVSAKDAEMLAVAVATRAQMVEHAAGTAGVQAPILRSRATEMRALAKQLHTAAERIRR